MRALLYGVPAAALAIVVVAKTAKVETLVKPGSLIPIEMICKNSIVPENLAGLALKDPTYGLSQVEWENAVNRGDCMNIPRMLARVVDVIHETDDFVDGEGDTVRVTVVRVEDAKGNRGYSIQVPIIKPAPKS